MWISVAETPISVAFGASLPDCAATGAPVTNANAHTSTATLNALRSWITFPPGTAASQIETETRL
jgi:hypothetical protein